MPTPNTDKMEKPADGTPAPAIKANEPQALNAEAVAQYLNTHPQEWDKIKVKKGDEELSIGDGVNRGLMQSDYTRKAQELAAQKKAFAENPPAVTKDTIRTALGLDAPGPAEPISPFSSEDLAAAWGEKQIIEDPVGYARAVASEAATQRKEFDSRLKNEINAVKKDIQDSRTSEAYQRDVAEVRLAVPDFTEDKNPALWHLAHQAFLGQNSQKPNVMLDGKIPSTMTFAEVAIGIKSYIGKVGEAEHQARLAAVQKRNEGAVTLGPNSTLEISYPAEIEAIASPRERMKARAAYYLAKSQGGGSTSG